MQFFALQDPDDEAPYGVVCKDEQGIPRLFVPGEGLMHIPVVAMWTHGDEPGSHPISQAQAAKLMRDGVGRVDPQVAQTMKGTAETLPAPGE